MEESDGMQALARYNKDLGHSQGGHTMWLVDLPLPHQGLITGHGHLRKHLHRVGILQEDPLCRMCDEQEETAEHLLFDCPSVARERYAIFGSLDKGGEFPQEDLIGTAETVDWSASWCASGVHKRPLRLKCMVVGHPIEEEEEPM
ncbi:hypothetical protein J6590_061117 [Homalodisca vitripennis]|nr:hypothetical protein J6590_061117 [Homalodisca vitripennis]